MRITQDNYEAFLLDRMEGNLNTEQDRELEIFLLANPELAPEFDTLPVLDASEELGSVEKRALKKQLPPAGFDLNQLDDLLIAKLEGDLSFPQLEKLDALIANNPEVALSWRQIAATKTPASSVKFGQKRKLKKGGVVIPLYRFTAIAASIALLLGALWMFGPSDNGTQIASHTIEDDHKLSTEESKNVVKKVNPIKNVVDHATKKIAPLKNNKTLTAVTGPSPRSKKGTSKRINAREERTERVMLTAMKTKRAFERGTHVLELPKTNPVRFVIPENTPMTEVSGFTVPELLANVVRTEVLDQKEAPHDELNGTDAVAMVDRGLNRISNGNAGLTVKKGDERRRWGLRLGSFQLEANLRN